MKRAAEMRILSPTAILGYGYPESSFRRGLARRPHLIAVDAGSTDPGPYYLGSGKPFTDRAAVKRDLRHMLVAGVRRGIPVVIGSAGGSGARPHVDWCEEIIAEIAAEEKLSFSLGVVYADIKPATVRRALAQGRIQPLACVPPLTAERLAASTQVVAQMGMEPLMRLLEQGCQVVLAGRCYDPAVFAALPVLRGFDPGLALHLGKILECAAIAATPGSGADCVLGVLRQDHFILEALSPVRRFTRVSTAAHTLYEKSDPTLLPGPGGSINLEQATFTELGDGRVEVRGSRFEPSPTYLVKLEAAAQVGFRTIAIAGVRDPVMIRQIDAILAAVQKQVDDVLRREKIAGQVRFIVYGKDGVMGPREPVKTTLTHELGIVIEAVGASQQEADSLCGLTRSTLLHYGYPERISTAGNLAFPFSPSDARMGSVYEFSLYHLMPLADPCAFTSAIRHIGQRPANRRRKDAS